MTQKITPKQAMEAFAEILEQMEKDDKDVFLEGLYLVVYDKLSRQIISRALEPEQE